MQEYSRILIEEYCVDHNSTKSHRLRKLIEMLFGSSAMGTDPDAIFLEKATYQEMNL